MCLKHEALAVLVVAADAANKLRIDEYTKDEIVFEIDRALLCVASCNGEDIRKDLEYHRQVVQALSSALMMHSQNPGSWMRDDPLCVIRRAHELIRDCLRAWLGDVSP